MADLLVIVPSRGRPQSVARVVRAWLNTAAYEHADLVFAVDADDPQHDAYWQHLPDGDGRTLVRFVSLPQWRPMVPKLNEVALAAAQMTPDGGSYFALGFAGDDHLPRTSGWAWAYLNALREMGTGIVYGDDGFQSARLPTQWAMTADIVRTLGAMVPAQVEHLYCDNAVKDLGVTAGCLRYLPHVLVEHMHPLAGKADPDDGYRRVNARDQYAKDAAAYQHWLEHRMPGDVETVRALRRQSAPTT